MFVRNIWLKAKKRKKEKNVDSANEWIKRRPKNRFVFMWSKKTVSTMNCIKLVELCWPDAISQSFDIKCGEQMNLNDVEHLCMYYGLLCEIARMYMKYFCCIISDLLPSLSLFNGWFCNARPRAIISFSDSKFDVKGKRRWREREPRSEK